MFKISKRQLDLLADYTFRNHCRIIIANNYGVNEENITQMIAALDEKAREYGLYSEFARFKYIHVGMLFGKEFDIEREELRSILGQTQVNANDRAYILEEKALEIITGNQDG